MIKSNPIQSKYLNLSKKERHVCEQLSLTDETLHKRRAQALLLVIDQGLTHPKTAELTGLTTDQIGYCMRRFRLVRMKMFPPELIQQFETVSSSDSDNVSKSDTQSAPKSSDKKKQKKNKKLKKKDTAKKDKFEKKKSKKKDKAKYKKNKKDKLKKKDKSKKNQKKNKRKKKK